MHHGLPILIALVLFAAPVAMAEDAPPRYRVIVSTDIGGADNDDFQSMVHFLLYTDVMDVEGLVASPPMGGRAKHLHEAIDAYAEDYPKLARVSARYPTPAALRALVKQGAIDPAPEAGFREATDGSKLIVDRARAADDRPLYVLVWGSITDVAQAVHDAPDIKDRIRVYFISSWNRRCDQNSRDYLYNNHRDLWWVESDTTFRGMYVGGNQAGDLGNKSFPEQHVRGHGALGRLFMEKLPVIKMGDTPAVLYMLHGDPGDPTADHWGGRYAPTDHGPHYWTDDPDPGVAEPNYPGAKTVNCWREEYLRDWQKRMAPLAD